MQQCHKELPRSFFHRLIPMSNQSIATGNAIRVFFLAGNKYDNIPSQIQKRLAVLILTTQQIVFLSKLNAKLEYAANAKIIRFRKIAAEANPFDEKWTGYYEERDGERMLNSTKGREKLVKIWNNQKRCCPVCGERITSETGFKTHFNTENNRKWPAIMVHPWCHRKLHEPGYLI